MQFQSVSFYIQARQIFCREADRFLCSAAAYERVDLELQP